MNPIKLSLSARGNSLINNIEQHCGFILGHLNHHSTLPKMGIQDVSTVFGTVNIPSLLYGGRTNMANNGQINYDLLRQDVYRLYDKGIGIKLTLSVPSFTDDDYKQSLNLLKTFNKPNNSVVVSNNELAKRIKNDYPNFNIEASSILSLEGDDLINAADNDSLYDHIVPPIIANDDLDTLTKIKNKHKIVLFGNVDCSYSCPNKICYKTIGKCNKTTDISFYKCSVKDFNTPRLFYKDEVDWLNFYFDFNVYINLGFSNFKILQSDAAYMHVSHLYKNKPETLYY
jgi:hypothetical protein